MLETKYSEESEASGFGSHGLLFYMFTTLFETLDKFNMNIKNKENKKKA